MKCPNCGFEVEGKFCTMCGTPMPTENTQSPPLKNDDNNAFNQQSANYVPFQQEHGSNFQVGTQQPQNILTNKFPQAQGKFTPITQQAPTKPKSKKTKKIVLSSVVGAIILAGFAIMIFSAIVNSFDTPIESSEQASYNPINHQKGEIAETLFGNITLTDIQTGYFSSSSDMDIYLDSIYANGDYKYMFKFSIENTSNKEMSVSYNDFYVSTTNGVSNEHFTNIEINGNPSNITLKPQSTADFIIYRYPDTKIDDACIKITYSYTFDGKKGSVNFIKNSPNIYANMFQTTKTDFGTFTVKNVSKPSTEDIIKEYYSENKQDQNSINFADKSCTIYEFTAEIENAKHYQDISLTEISGEYSIDTLDGINEEYIFPIAILTENSTVASPNDISIQTEVGKTQTIKFLMIIPTDCKDFEMTFNFDNNNSVIYNFAVSELEEHINSK